MRRFNKISTVITVSFSVIALFLIFDVNALPPGEVELIMPFDMNNLEAAEGLVLDSDGNIFVSMTHIGEIWQITPEGVQSVLWTGLYGALGMAVDSDDNIFVAVASFDPETQGVYKIDRQANTCDRIPGTESLVFPDGLDLDICGNLYITDPVLGAIYRYPASGSAATVWIQHELLQGTGFLYGAGVPIGVNGIHYYWGSIIVSNTEQCSIVKIPVAYDGSAGEPIILHQGAYDEITLAPLEYMPDGIDVDFFGNIYAADPGFSQIYKVSYDGSSVNVLATHETLLDNPTSLFFGTRWHDWKNLYIVNYDLYSQEDETNFGFPVNDDGPSIVKINTGYCF